MCPAVFALSCSFRARRAADEIRGIDELEFDGAIIVMLRYASRLTHDMHIKNLDTMIEVNPAELLDEEAWE